MAAAVGHDSPKISAFVITCDRDPITLRAVLKSARFADQLIVLDKGRQRALNSVVDIADQTFEAPWSPVVEDTRELALQECQHEWVVCLDDDEILSSSCASVFHDFVTVNRADVLGVPIRHHVLGRHDDRAYYFPEWRPTLFRKGAVEYGPTVHGGTRIVGTFMRLMEGHEAFITHLSHPDVATWLEKTNRYTSVVDRAGIEPPPPGQFVPWALTRLQAYLRNPIDDDYLAAVAILRGMYDVIDGLKRWELSQPNGYFAFAEMLDRCAS